MGIFEVIYQFATNYIASWGYWGLILGMALESACMPVPSEIVLPFGGFMVSRGILSFWPAVFAGVLGGTLGSVIAYIVGASGGRALVLKYGKFILITPNDMRRADYWFDRYGSKIVFWARFLPVVRTFISLPAGIARMNFSRFLIYTILGSIPWGILFTYLGVKMGENWRQVRLVFEEFDYAIIIVIVALIAIWVIKKLKHIKAEQ